MKTIFLFIFALSVNCNALTLSDLRDDVRSQISDSQGTRQRFSNSEINSWINEAQRLADIKTLCNYKAFSFDLVAGTTYYSLPSNFVMIRRVTRDYLSIPEMTPAGLDGRSAEWETASGVPTYYFINFSSRTKIGFAPFPLVAADTATIRVEYMAYSSAMSADSDVPFNGTVEFYPYHPALADYAASKASSVDERDSKAKSLLDSFIVAITIMKDTCTRRDNYLPSGVARQ